MKTLAHLMSPSEVAEISGVSRWTILAAIRRGELPAYETTIGHLVRPADAEEFARRRAARHGLLDAA